MPTETLKTPGASVSPRLAASRPGILHLVESFDQGGSERQALQMVRMLHRQDAYNLRLASLKAGGLLREEAIALKLGEIPAYPLTSFYDFNFLVQLRRFSARLREWKVKLIHTHDFYTNIFGMAAGALARVPVRVASRRDLGVIRSAAQRFLEHRAYSMAHRVVANSEAVRRQLLAEGVPEQKIVVIHNGIEAERVTVDPSIDRRAAFARLSLPQGKERQVVTMVANFRLPAKDHATFLRAAQRVRAELPDTLFVLAGEGEKLPEMSELAQRLGLNDSAVFVGRCDHLAELLAVSQVCVSSSTSEGFSNAILEYMAAARPVVATDVGGAGEAIVEGETGYLVPPGGDGAMASRIAALLRDRDRAAAMGQRGRERVFDRFLAETQLNRIQELYSQLLAEAGTA